MGNRREEAEQKRRERAEARRIAKANLPSLGNLRAETRHEGIIVKGADVSTLAEQVRI